MRPRWKSRASLSCDADACARVAVSFCATRGEASVAPDADSGAAAQSNSDVTSNRLMVVPPDSDRDAHVEEGAAGSRRWASAGAHERAPAYFESHHGSDRCHVAARGGDRFAASALTRSKYPAGRDEDCGSPHGLRAG